MEQHNLQADADAPLNRTAHTFFVGWVDKDSIDPSVKETVTCLHPVVAHVNRLEHARRCPIV